jgi:hypothetical protein
MAEHVITVVDTTGIQNYIFGSNRLRDNIGASQLVDEATGPWVYQTLRDQQTNIADDPLSTDPFNHDAKMEDGLVAELLYAGGGNALILFKSKEYACNWARAYTRKLLQDAPGLEVVVAHSDPFAWDPQGHDLAGRIDDLMKNRLDAAKQNRLRSVPVQGLGVTATCQSTGLVAVDIDPTDDGHRISSEVQAKLSAGERSDNRFNEMFEDFWKLGLKLPRDFDDMGRSRGEQSYMAVVHADGNGMGDRFKAVGKGKPNRQYITDVRDLSLQVQRASTTALQTALATLIDSNGKLVKPFKEHGNLPFRPLVYGGDDVTFVCDGRPGLALAAAYLQAFEDETKDLPGGGQATACAGVAIVKTHYPFARAYALAEELCKHAKRWVHEKTNGDSSFSALDWHIASSGVLANIAEVRKREYTVAEGSLTMRPLRLNKTRNEWRTWPAFYDVVQIFHTDDKWKGKRNKIKRLREVLREGATATEQFLHLYQMSALPVYPSAPGALAKQGWLEEICGYFDAIEAMEFLGQGDAL